MPKTLEDLQGRDMLTLEDIADYLGVCYETARRIVHKRGCPLFAYEKTLRAALDMISFTYMRSEADRV